MKIIETLLGFGPMTCRKKTTAIVVHHSAHKTWNVYEIHEYHKNTKKWSGIGYHFFVDKEGSIYRGRPENNVGAHCFNHNNYTIGICVQGDYMTESMPEKQKAAVIELCGFLCDKYKMNCIKAHRELNATSCPGKNFPVEEIKKESLQLNTMKEKG